MTEPTCGETHRSLRRGSRGGHSILLFVLMAWLSAAGVGCGATQAQKTAGTAFCDAATLFSDTASLELTTDRNEIIEIQTSRNDFRDTPIAVADLDNKFTLDELNVRLNALSALKNYAGLMRSLITDDSNSRVATSATALVGNLQKIKGIDMTGAQSDAMGKLITFLGTQVIEAERREAMKNVALLADGPIDQLVDLVTTERTSDKGVIHVRYKNAVDELKTETAAAAQIKKLAVTAATASQAAANVTAIGDVKPAIKANSDLVQAESDLATVSKSRASAELEAAKKWDRFDKMSDALKKSGASMVSAQKQFKTIMTSNNIDMGDVMTALDDAQQLVTIYTALKTSK